MCEKASRGHTQSRWSADLKEELTGFMQDTMIAVMFSPLLLMARGLREEGIKPLHRHIKRGKMRVCGHVLRILPELVTPS